LSSNANTPGHVLILDRLTLGQHRLLRFQLCLANLTLLGLHRDLGIELVFLDSALLLDRCIAPYIGRIIRLLEDLLSDLSLKRACGFGVGLTARADRLISLSPRLERPSARNNP
jgi:hypothetical protein